MSLDSGEPGVFVLSSSWRRTESELSFVTRAVAGATSRSANTTVLTQMPAGTIEADGAFDLVGVGIGDDDVWPDRASADWTHQPASDAAWIVDEPSESARTFLRGFTDSTVHSIAPVLHDPDVSLRQLHLVPSPVGPMIGLHVPINPLASAHRHTGLGFTGYLLVLTDRSSTPTPTPPTPIAAWLTARFPDQRIVVIEGGSAVVWMGRALRGVIPVDTRMDLWRLMAHASITVDLNPGNIVARECIESLRFGTPIVVPDGSVGAVHAHAGGGLTFTEMSELFERVLRLLSETERSRFSRSGAHYADSAYGDPDAFVAGIASALRGVYP